MITLDDWNGMVVEGTKIPSRTHLHYSIVINALTINRAQHTAPPKPPYPPYSYNPCSLISPNHQHPSNTPHAPDNTPSNSHTSPQNHEPAPQSH